VRPLPTFVSLGGYHLRFGRSLAVWLLLQDHVAHRIFAIAVLVDAIAGHVIGAGMSSAVGIVAVVLTEAVTVEIRVEVAGGIPFGDPWLHWIGGAVASHQGHGEGTSYGGFGGTAPRATTGAMRTSIERWGYETLASGTSAQLGHGQTTLARGPSLRKRHDSSAPTVNPGAVRTVHPIMRDWKAALVAGLLLAATPACVSAYDRALEHGHALVAQAKYRDAYAAYRRAAELDPDEPEVQRLLAQVRPYAIEEATEDARAQISKGKWEKAAEHADFVAKLDAARGARVHGEIQKWMKAALDALVSHEKMAQAYPLAIRSHRLYPKMPGLIGIFDKLRKHYLAKSDAALAGRDYRRAMAALDVIAKYEPKLESSMLAERRTKVRYAWADHVASLAEKAERDGHLGAAAALYARAYEVAARPAERQAMTERLTVLAEQGHFILVLREKSPASRPALGPHLSAELRGLDGVRVSTSSDAGSMLVSVHASPHVCTQTFTTSNETKTYQSGTRRVPNPAHRAIVADVASVEGQLAGVDADIGRLRPQARREGRDHRRCLSGELAPKEAASQAAQAKLDATKANLDAQQVVVDNLRRRWQSATDDEKAELRRQLDDAEAELARRKSEHDAARRAKDSAARTERSARSSCERHERSLRQIRNELERKESSRSELASRLAQLQADRVATPSQIDEPVYSDLTYPVEHHVRRCVGPVTVDLDPAWSSPSRRQLDPAGATEDERHDAYPVAGVSVDPLTFPIADNQLRRTADDVAIDEVKKMVAAMVRDYYADLSDRAVELAAASPHDATDMMLSIYVAAPKQFTTDDRTRIAKHLREHYGLEKLSVLLR